MLAKRYYEQKDLEAQGGLKEVEEEIDKTVAGLCMGLLMRSWRR